MKTSNNEDQQRTTAKKQEHGLLFLDRAFVLAVLIDMQIFVFFRYIDRFFELNFENFQ